MNNQHDEISKAELSKATIGLIAAAIITLCVLYVFNWLSDSYKQIVEIRETAQEVSAEAYHAKDVSIIEEAISENQELLKSRSLAILYVRLAETDEDRVEFLRRLANTDYHDNDFIGRLSESMHRDMVRKMIDGEKVRSSAFLTIDSIVDCFDYSTASMCVEKSEPTKKSI